MTDAELKLVYFNSKGRAELIRLLLTVVGKEFEDNRITKEDWVELKPLTPFGQLPVLEVDNKAYAQSLALANFIAREFGLYGQTNLDALQIDQVAQLTEDFFQSAVKALHETDEAKKTELEEELKENTVPKFLAFYEKLLNENDTGYFAGDNLTMADVILYDVATGFMKAYVEGQIDKFPLVKALVEKVSTNERIQAYQTAQQ